MAVGSKTKQTKPTHGIFRCIHISIEA